ncbi:PREDICTED: ras-related protein Rab-39B-like [Tauraco erythrolophus]|uniref:ras-related protein Rab-39B-like n=1 Tax=Tauraco erythrolophus TaxID=121530 RepID=UPI0005238E55|nr:PREDICTED: ras-related protein Rab-39B-like [Tauraco erythrolophus]
MRWNTWFEFVQRQQKSAVCGTQKGRDKPLVVAVDRCLLERARAQTIWEIKRSITRAYYRNSVGGLLLFDITVFVLVGHKCDLDTQRQVTRHEAEKLAAAYGMKYIETSARDAINVEKAFTDLTRDIYELVKRGEISIQEGWEGVKSGFVPNVVHSSEEVVKSDRRCLC